MAAAISSTCAFFSTFLGVKGRGEASCAGSLPSVMNAVVDALSVYSVRHINMPATPERVWKAIQAAKAADREKKITGRQ